MRRVFFFFKNEIFLIDRLFYGGGEGPPARGQVPLRPPAADLRGGAGPRRSGVRSVSRRDFFFLNFYLGLLVFS